MSSAGLKAGLLVVGIAAGGGAAWLLQLRPAAPPQRLSPSFPSVPLASAPIVMPAASPRPPSAAVSPAARPAPSALASPEAQSRKERWEKSFPGEPLPYALSGIGPKPGPSTQQIAGFTVTAQASDALGALGSPVSSYERKEKPHITTMLTANSSSVAVKNISWELNQNGLSAEGITQTGESFASAGLRPRGTGQEAEIIQTPRITGKPPKFLIVRGLLRQAEDYEEPLAFQTPETLEGAGSKSQSQQTPSGVTVTLPPQGLLASGGNSGDSSVLRLSFQMQPSGPVELPQSPLFQKYRKPVLVRVGAMTSNGSAYDYPFSDPNPQGWMSLYNQPNQPWQYGPNTGILRLVVQQRVYTHEIPFALRVPVTHKAFVEPNRR